MRLRSLSIGLLLLLLLVVVCLPLFQSGFLYIHDFVHAARIGEMWRGLSSGHWPVRWSEYFGFGYGMPLFQFYAPLPYLVGAVFFGLGVDVVVSMKLLFILASLLAITGAFAVGKRLGDDLSGVVTAVLFGLAPYRAVNLYVRGALSESWAMAFFPWITLGIILVLQRWRWGWLLLTTSLVGLWLSHNLSSLMFVPISLVVAVVGVFIYQRSAVQAVLRELLGAYVLSGLLAAFYLLPAFLEKNYTQLNLILSGYFDFRLHFVYIRQLFTPYWGYGGSGWGIEDGLSFFLGWGFLLGLVIVGGVLANLLFRRRQSIWQDEKVKWVVVSIGLAGVALVMTLGRSQVVWEHVPLISYIQFPWRWLAVASWWLAVAIGLSCTFVSAKVRVLLALTLCSVAIYTQAPYFKPEKLVQPADALYYTDPTKIATYMSEILMDYIPVGFDYQWAKLQPLRPGQLIVEPLELQNTPLVVDQPQYRLVEINLAQPRTVVLGIAAFPHWEVRVNQTVVDTVTTPQGLLAVTVPAGEHSIEATWRPTALRQVSDLMSLSGLAVLGVWIYWVYNANLVVKQKE